MTFLVALGLSLLFTFLSWVTESRGRNPHNRWSDTFSFLSLLSLVTACMTVLVGVARLFGFLAF